MTKKKFSKPKTAPNKCPLEFRHEAVLLAAPVGVVEAADKLGIQTSQIYAWRRRRHRLLCGLHNAQGGKGWSGIDRVNRAYR